MKLEDAELWTDSQSEQALQEPSVPLFNSNKPETWGADELLGLCLRSSGGETEAQGAEVAFPNWRWIMG